MCQFSGNLLRVGHATVYTLLLIINDLSSTMETVWKLILITVGSYARVYFTFFPGVLQTSGGMCRLATTSQTKVDQQVP